MERGDSAILKIEMQLVPEGVEGFITFNMAYVGMAHLVSSVQVQVSSTLVQQTLVRGVAMETLGAYLTGMDDTDFFERLGLIFRSAIEEELVITTTRVISVHDMVTLIVNFRPLSEGIDTGPEEPDLAYDA
ncbi:hypothetical protein ONE63_008036 [Megalurothrips usitatus]|uniref:Uncharacterized protein n=1 Tax=Megalurothrips usitatus TaxID=439358 RepID=A0AAV7XTN4_9NEOP|nr:hypothetical protein ONE63_008036 [Megalurothrips usitatus]